MLVLGRKTGESVVISDNIVVTILSVERDQVKLGIEAPRQIPVVRKELFEALKAQKHNRRAVGERSPTFTLGITA